MLHYRKKLGASKVEIYTVKLSKIIEEFKLETIHLPDLPENILVSCSRVNRPGLQMVGFYDHYEQERIQIIGKVEHLFLGQLNGEERSRRLEDFFRSSPVGVIYTTPTRLFLNEKGFAKLAIAIARGKKQYDKRDSIKERDDRRAMDRAMKY